MSRILTGLSYRDSIDPVTSGTMNIVTAFADLPLASENADVIYHVKTTTGTLFSTRKRAGQYISDGADWIYISGLQNAQELPDGTGHTTQFLRGDLTWATPATDVGSVAWGAITGTLSAQTDLDNALDGKTPFGHTHLMTEVTDLPAFGDAIGLNLGTSAGTLSEGNHNHNLADLIEKSYNSLTNKPTLGNAAAKDVGTGATNVAAGDHTHTGTYAPALGADDNYVTDAEKSNLHAPGSDNQDLSGLITKATLLAQSVMAAVSTSTPIPIIMSEGTVMGRATGGNVTAMSIDIDLSTVSGSDDTIPSAKATKTALDGKQTTTLTSGNILVGNGSNVAASVTPGGDLSMTNAGVFAVNKTRLNVRNETGTTIASSKVVYISGFNNFPLISLCDNTDENKHNVIGITVAPINNLSNGYVAVSGQCDAETNVWTVGTELYMSTAGALTSTIPTAGGVRHVGIVTVQGNYPTGKILVYTHDEEFIKAVSSGYDYTIRLGDSAGAKKLLIKDYANTEVASVDSDGNAIFTAVTPNNLTASELVAADANKKLESLPIATYPSKTELAYVKGVTSAIQTQINGKAATTHTHSPLIAHTVAVQGEIKVPSGGTDYIPGFFVAVPSGQTVKLHSCRYKIYSGTSVTAKIQVNGSDATGFTSISVGTTAATTTPTSVTLADGDYVQLVPTAVSGTPTHLSFTIFLEYTK